MLSEMSIFGTELRHKCQYVLYMIRVSSGIRRNHRNILKTLREILIINRRKSTSLMPIKMYRTVLLISDLEN